MQRPQNNRLLGGEKPGTRGRWDLSDLLHPAHAYEHPSRVVNDPDLTLNEKRAILASWASDACAAAAAPHLHRTPSARRPVRFDDVIDALRALDKETQAPGGDRRRYRWRWWKNRAERRSPPPCRERHAHN
ncbi:MAG TPA: hypothetical protein VMF32_19410 [Xanthobacteraceae bacterium]|nr:hypothetical protein [Xanthobacteraceae bacterium]